MLLALNVATRTIGGNITRYTGRDLALEPGGGYCVTLATGATASTLLSRLVGRRPAAVTIAIPPNGQGCTVANSTVANSTVVNANVIAGAVGLAVRGNGSLVFDWAESGRFRLRRFE